VRSEVQKEEEVERGRYRSINDNPSLTHGIQAFPSALLNIIPETHNDLVKRSLGRDFQTSDELSNFLISKIISEEDYGMLVTRRRRGGRKGFT
jgi:hypothetical protein